LRGAGSRTRTVPEQQRFAAAIVNAGVQVHVVVAVKVHDHVKVNDQVKVNVKVNAQRPLPPSLAQILRRAAPMLVSRAAPRRAADAPARQYASTESERGPWAPTTSACSMSAVFEGPLMKQP